MAGQRSNQLNYVPRRNGQHGQHVKLASIPSSSSRDPEHLSLLCH